MTFLWLFFLPLRLQGYSCNRNRFCCRILGLAGETLRFAGRKPKGNREKNGTFLSLAYTQMIVCLYANYRSSILKLKRISKR